MILATASAYNSTNNATVGGVGNTVQKLILPFVTFIKEVDNRIFIASFIGNPKTMLVCSYSTGQATKRSGKILQTTRQLDFYYTFPKQLDCRW